MGTKAQTDMLTASERDFKQALAKIYAVYGPDLHAFLSDVQRKLIMERSQTVSRSVQTNQGNFTKGG